MPPMDSLCASQSFLEELDELDGDAGLAELELPEEFEDDVPEESLRDGSLLEESLRDDSLLAESLLDEPCEAESPLEEESDFESPDSFFPGGREDPLLA